jgi:hypothetical protein
VPHTSRAQPGSGTSITTRSDWEAGEGGVGNGEEAMMRGCDIGHGGLAAPGSSAARTAGGLIRNLEPWPWSEVTYVGYDAGR